MIITTLQQDKTETIVPYQQMTFSGGEEQIRLDPQFMTGVVEVFIKVRLTSSAKVMQLILAVDAIRQVLGNSVSITLKAYYFPYARQDRVCVEGESFAAKVMCDLINSLNFSDVIIWDAHSEVIVSLLNNAINYDQSSAIKKCDELMAVIKENNVTLVSPDKGASQKTIAVANTLNPDVNVIQSLKQRDPKTGKILSTELSDDVTGLDVLIIDDICDGGRTFTELAKVLKDKGANTISLYVTHGIFSKGLGVFDGLIDKIYTTDSFRDKHEFIDENNILTIIEI